MFGVTVDNKIIPFFYEDFFSRNVVDCSALSYICKLNEVVGMHVRVTSRGAVDEYFCFPCVQFFRRVVHVKTTP